MRCLSLLAVLILLCPMLLAEDLSWPLDSVDSPDLSVHGDVAAAAGAEGNSIVFDGTSLLKVKDSERRTRGENGFTLTAWVNPYLLSGEQQMIAAKNRYSLGERQWGVMIDEDNRFRLYVYQGRWETAGSSIPPRPGHWHLIGVVIRSASAELWVNGKLAGRVKLTKPIPQTKAPLMFGGVDDNGRIWQNFVGALDEVCLVDKPLDAKQMAAAYKPVTATHNVPEPRKTFTLWTGAPIPSEVEQIPFAEGIKHSTIHRPARDGYRFLHGAAIVEHNGVMYANWANSPTNENGPHETLQGRRSTDDGLSWSELEVIGPGFEGGERHSHGVLFVHKGELWTICARFGVGTPGRRFPGLQAEAFVLDEQTDRWKSRGIVMKNCWPYDEPVRMDNGNFITGGQDKDGLPVVAISHGDDLTKWDSVLIPYHRQLQPSFAETTVWFEGGRVTAVIRGGGGVAWVSTSDDYGRTWTKARASNLPMPRAKAYLGKLSTGQLYLISNLKNRDTLVVSVSRPGESTLSSMWRIRHGKSDAPRFPGRAKSKQWSYPYGYEHQGKLYIVYSVGKEECGLTTVPVKSSVPRPPSELRSGPKPPHPETNPDSPIMLSGSWLPKDSHQLDFKALPRVPSEHVVISDVRAKGPDKQNHKKGGVNQHNYLAFHDGRFCAMWSDGPSIEDRVGQVVKYATSDDGLKWTEPQFLTPYPPNSGPDSPYYDTRSEEGMRWIARGFWKREGELLALASLDEAAGFFGPSLELRAFRFNKKRDAWENAGLIYKNAINNFPPRKLRTGDWLMSRRPHNYSKTGVHFLVGGVKAIDDWKSYPVLGSASELKAEEPGWWILPDNSLSAIFRDNRGSGYIYRAFSTDDGRTWSKPVKTNFPDATSKLRGIRLSDGRYVLVSNSNPKARNPLTLAISPDGLVFTKLMVVVDAQKLGYGWIDYPDVMEHEGSLYIAFAGSKGSVNVLKVKLSDVDAVKMPTFPLLASEQTNRAVRGADEEPAFVSLFDGKSFTGWKHGGNWVIEDGTFFRKKGGGSLTYTKALVPDDFELRFEWKVSKGCNSGVYYRPAQYEYQILDNVHSAYGENPRQAAGSLFFCMAPSKDATKPFGQWNSGRVKCKGTVIEHWVNGERVLSFDYTEPKWATQVELLKIRGADLNARGGRLWLQDHGQDVWFRNLRWREIPGDEELTADPDFVPMPVTGQALSKEQDRVKRMLEARTKKQSQ